MTNPERKPQILQPRYEGDPVLRLKCRRLAKEEILSPEIQNLIDDIKYTCDEKDYGVGLSAPQVGEAVAISVIAVKPTPNRPNLKPFVNVCINTEITKTFGEKEPMWEACFSTLDENGEIVYGQVPRYKEIEVKYLDRNGDEHIEKVEGFVAHVLQHETDHLEGVLFTDYVNREDLITNQEYREKVLHLTQKSV